MSDAGLTINHNKTSDILQMFYTLTILSALIGNIIAYLQIWRIARHNYGMSILQGQGRDVSIMMKEHIHG